MISCELKLVGDGYAGGFSCGMTMGDSGSMENAELIEESEKRLCYRLRSGLVLCVEKTVHGDVTVLRTIVKNESDKPVVMEMLSSFVIRGVELDWIYRLQSGWSAEGKLRKESIQELHLEKSWNGCAYRIEKFGNVGSMPVRKYFPFLAVENSRTGEFHAVQLYLASSWQMEIRCKESEKYTLAGGIADGDFGQWKKELRPGESFEAPKAVIASGFSLDEVCDKLVREQNPHIAEADENMGIVFNEYCTTWGNPSFENVKRICDKIADKDIQYLVIDSGWYGKSENWWNSIGEWTVNEERFPGGMREIADYIRSKGMIPGLWFEMESVTSGAKYYQEAEHLVKKDGSPLTVGNRRFWDMEDEWVRLYLGNAVIGTLKEAGFGYLKVDYNDSMGMGCDGADGPGENLRRKVEASKAFFQRICEEIPGIVIENCSSGGHRLEPSMLELVSQASFSDAHETKAIPLIAANLHRVMQPRQSQIWAVLRPTDSDDRIFYSMASTFLGRMCLSGDIYAMSEHQWELIEQGMSFYRQAADIIRDGKTIMIHAEAHSYNEPEGSQLVVRENGTRGMVVFHRFANSTSLEQMLNGRGHDGGSYRILSTYGEAGHDFSAQAILYEKV